MNFIKNPIVFVIALILCGCGANNIKPIDLQSKELLKISGAVNTTFNTDDTYFQCQGVIKNWDIGNTLILSLRANINSENENEQVSLYLYIPLASDKIPIAGKYYSHVLSDNFCGVSYKNQWDKQSFTKYRFETGLVRMVIEESENNRLIGKFSLYARQSYAQHTLNGQVENIKLANKGKITVSGKIDIILDS